MNTTIIQYGIGKDYLKDWGINEALREIYQNFIDYGTYRVEVIDTNKGIVDVIISNKYIPENLEFLQIGKSIKDNKEAIGQHGEGLKMAMLIFLRLDYRITIHTNDKMIFPMWKNQDHVGETLALAVTHKKIQSQIAKFAIRIQLPIEEFNKFNNNVIIDKDIVFTAPYHGSIVDKPKGNLYSGNLFICNLKNLKLAYNLNPSVLKLDRDRRVPGSFETSYHTSKINEARAEIDFIDQDFDDYKFVQSIPKTHYSSIKPKIINDNIEFVATTKEGSQVIIKNESIKNQLKEDSYFSKAMKGIKKFLISRLGINDLLLKFRQEHCHTNESKIAFDLILDKLGIELVLDKLNDLPF